MVFYKLELLGRSDRYVHLHCSNHQTQEVCVIHIVVQTQSIDNCTITSGLDMDFQRSISLFFLINPESELELGYCVAA